jgi:hypothetical protein
VSRGANPGRGGDRGHRPYNFHATVAAYVVVGLVAALVIRLIALSAPGRNWIVPRTAAGATTPAAAGPARVAK